MNLIEKKMLLLACVLLALFPLVIRAQDNVDVCNIDNCDTVERQLTIQDIEGKVNFKGCPGDLIKLKFSPKREVRCELSVIDNERRIFFKDGFQNGEDVEMYSLTNNTSLEYKLTESGVLDVFYGCQKHLDESETFINGSDTVETILEPNMELGYTLESTKDGVYLVDIELESTPGAGLPTIPKC